MSDSTATLLAVTRPADVSMRPPCPPEVSTGRVLRAGQTPPAPPGWSAELGARGHQVLASPHDPRGHARLAGLAPRPRVVHLLVTDVAVHLQHAVVVAEHVVRNRPGE